MGGRKGYEIEKEQLDKMNTVLNGVIELSEKVLNGKATVKDIKAIETIKPLALKFCDKFHANRQAVDVTTNGKDLPMPILQNVQFDNGNIQNSKAD